MFELLQLLLGGGHGVLHLGLQLVVVALVIAAGDVLFGLESQFRVSQAVVGLVSIVVSLVILTVSHVSCQEGGRLARDLATPPHSTSYMLTSIGYILTTTMVSTLSALVLCSLLYVDTVQLTSPGRTDQSSLPPAGIVHTEHVDVARHSLLLHHLPQYLPGHVTPGQNH